MRFPEVYIILPRTKLQLKFMDKRGTYVVLGGLWLWLWFL